MSTSHPPLLRTTVPGPREGPYPHLSQPIDIGSVRLKNRIMKNGTGYFWDDPASGSFMNQRYLDHSEALARGGAALISAATGPLTRDLKARMPGFRVTADEYIPGWQRWAETIHAHDCLAFHQLFQLGPMTPLFVTAPPGKSASELSPELSPRLDFGDFTAFSVAELEDFVDLFAGAAERMKKAGLDGTEVNGACNHLFNNFLSRAWNRRDDHYGTQTLENRTRLLVDVVREIKRRNGARWPVIVLFNAMEPGLRDGITLAESTQFARAFVEAGADALEVRAEYYTKRTESLHFPDMYFFPEGPEPLPPHVDGSRGGAGANIPMAAEIKAAVEVPVITVGRLDWEIGERAIREGEVDVISLNRRLLADPDLPRKVLAGRPHDVNPCTSCMTCFDSGEHFRPVVCRVNPALGREKEYELLRAPVPRRVLVVGGGPAGMEAARVAALRGHRVTLVERQPRLGGSMPIAAMIKGEQEDIPALVAYLDRQVREVGVDVRTGRALTPSLVRRLRPDVVLLATGGEHEVPDIPGIEGRNVLTAARLHHQAKTLLRFVGPRTAARLHRLPVARRMLIGERVVVIGGRLHGCQTAEYLVHLGKQVTIVDTATPEEIGAGLLEVFIKPHLLHWLRRNGVRFVTDVSYERVTKRGLIVSDGDGERLLPADTVLTALPLRASTTLEQRVARLVPDVRTIGDAAAPGLIIDAIAAGARAGREI